MSEGTSGAPPVIFSFDRSSLHTAVQQAGTIHVFDFYFAQYHTTLWRPQCHKSCSKSLEYHRCNWGQHLQLTQQKLYVVAYARRS